MSGFFITLASPPLAQAFISRTIALTGSASVWLSDSVTQKVVVALLAANRLINCCCHPFSGLS